VRFLSQLADLNAFIAASRTARTADDLRGIMEPVTREMGFDHYALFRQVQRFSWRKKRAIAVSNYPRAWLERFFHQKFHAHDPVLAASYRRSVGFRFEEVKQIVAMTEPRQKVMEEFRSAGLVDGYCVPAHIPGETNGVCSFVVRQGRNMPLGNLPMAQLVGTFAYEAARSLLRKGEEIVRGPGERESLTQRQLECIVLVGRGKTDWEISRVLGISEDTVTEHLNDARRRCGVSRRAELPIHALYRGELSFSDILN
jgi:LuxR family quorum-sensing system transcriptional regulator CciR